MDYYRVEGVRTPFETTVSESFRSEVSTCVTFLLVSFNRREVREEFEETDGEGRVGSSTKFGGHEKLDT